MFGEKERELLYSPSFSASAFRYATGVEALRVKAGRGEFIWLPYLGQQIWDWKVDGASLKFHGFIEEPSYGKTFLQNYGGFLIHCGATAMGNPGPLDAHPHHGELPTARFDEAWLEIDRDETLALCGAIHWKVPFVAEYRCSPCLKIYDDGLRAHVDFRLDNPTSKPLDYMYLAHINFAFEGAERILSSVPFDSKHAEIREEIFPGLVADPAIAKRIDFEATYEPELVVVIKHIGESVRAASILVHKDKSARWVHQESAELDHHIVWITHNGDRGACGFHLPSTAGPRGFDREKVLGNVKKLAAGDSVTLSYEFGFSDKLEDAPVVGAV